MRGLRSEFTLHQASQRNAWICHLPERSATTPHPNGAVKSIKSVAGSFVLTEVLFFHRASSTCIVGDLVQRFDEHTLGGFRRFLMKLDGLVGDEGSTPREWRLSFLHRARLRASLARAIAWSPRHLVIARGACALDDGAAVLRRSLGWALGSS